ncbi:MAG: DUF2333 family protein [Porticoccaceae bacterium]
MSLSIDWSRIKPGSIRSGEPGLDGHRGGIWKLILGVLVVLALLIVITGIWWSQEPDYQEARLEVIELSGGQNAQVGSLTTASVIVVVETLLDKPGGLLSNDVAPPGVYLDNIPHWEQGVIVQVRDLAKAMRDGFSRSQSQSQEDKALAQAEPNFNFGLESWIFPSSESEYRSGVEHIRDYLSRLQDDQQHNAQFYARADNLERWLITVENRLGSLSQRLSASVGQRRLNTDLAGDAQATQSTPASDEMMVKTPWLEIDDVFYEARGSTWAMIQFLRAIETDFAPVLQNKNAEVSLQQIIRELEATQAPSFPVVLNGGGFGLFANHSLVMASYISRAHAAIIDLRDLLSTG